jgi:pseudouridine-5'-monophosphatase
LPGVHKLVHHLKGTSRRTYDLKTAHLQSLFECFEGKVVCGDHKYNMKGKPAPDIFITAARGHPEVSETSTNAEKV